MRSDQTKTIAISQYLETVEGLRPANTRMGRKELWYHSPLRADDSNPSFKVDDELNLWHDHGLARGGNILDLVCQIKNSNISEALAILDKSGLYNNGYQPYRYKNSFKSSSQTQISKISPAVEKEKSSNKMLLLETKELSHNSLIQYLKSRCIDLDIAKQHLKEIHFKPQDKLIEYFALGFAVGDGFEARNKYFKGFVGTGKTISIINPKQNSSLLVFEGFMDFLSYLTYLKTQKNITELKSSIVILNSVSLKKHLLKAVEKYNFSKLYFFLDNDDSGRDAQDFFELALPNSQIIDKSSLYKDFKDFNEMLCSLEQN
ncbi:DNA primase, TraP-type [uncultured Gammaproteobacteria bacterium]|jgi:hypothetical protein|nr:DNA primase, TraP-type [uncultured Gammaproteobacteria bacterium]CAC9557411.1 DNA primase, TraP-type [uncultured Gammaproteobacteria bacterium]CAC9567341.1 DNA primase, TraP-type [uncultured Gammaproteobacteria bacterium]CAC9583810.1 DNA primase, TraP-type [uncultured Gammaproteobacteria bacterium]CAC9958976.1 DNA primase, TraP-type [uncultured Gammaproteobacteria bacterium]